MRRQSTAASIVNWIVVIFLLAIPLTAPDLTWGMYGMIASPLVVIYLMFALFSAPTSGFGLGTTNTHHNEQHIHNYPDQKMTFGTEIVTELPNGTIRTERQIRRFE